MRRIIFLFVTATCLYGQTLPTRVSPDDAAKHLLKQPSPFYPSSAEAGRITGTVVLEIKIDESGRTSLQGAIRGHPLLIGAAIEAVKSWKYQPFEFDGKPVQVLTFVMVTFGFSGNQPAEARADMEFLHEFWSAMDIAQAALAKSNSAVAEQELKKAEELLATVGDVEQHVAQRRQWATTMGHFYLAQRNFAESEKYYKEAFDLRPIYDKNGPEIAAALANIGNLYSEEKKYDLARDYVVRSIAIYQKLFKKAALVDSPARGAYGRSVAYQAWNLSKLASQQNDRAEFTKQCRTAFEFQSFINATDHDSFVSTCQEAPSSSTSKN